MPVQESAGRVSAADAESAGGPLTVCLRASRVLIHLMRRVTWSVHEPSKPYRDTGYFKRRTQGSFEELMSSGVLGLGASGG